MAREILMEEDGRRKLWYEKDPVTGLIQIRTQWKTDTGLAAVAERRKNTPGGFKTRKSKDGMDMHHVIWIPPAAVPQLVEMGICLPGGALVPGADKAFLRWAEQSAQKPLRTNLGRLI
jgi:hypothetical protein